jgi:hypothetical protein
MPVSKLQGKTGQNAVTAASLDITFDSTTRTGSTILVSANVFDTGAGPPTISSVTDSKGNTYSELSGSDWNSSADHLDTFRATNIAGGASHTVTVNFSGAGNLFCTAAITELAGYASSTTFVSNNGTSTTPNVSTLTTTKPVWAVVSHAGSGLTITEGTNYTLDNEIEAPTSGHAIGVEYKLAGPTTAPAWTLSGSAIWMALAMDVNDVPFQDAVYPNPPQMWPTTNVVSYGSH